MILINELKGRMVAAGYNQQTLSKALGITQKTLRDRLSRGEFKLSEVEKIVDLLSIKDPAAIFFAPQVAKNDTFKGA